MTRTSKKQRMVLRTTAVKGESRTVCELLAEGSGLSKLRIKDAMQKGAVWLARPGTSEKRLRRVSAVLRAGDVADLYYDGQLLLRIPPRAECRHDVGRFSIWFKPAGRLIILKRDRSYCQCLSSSRPFNRKGHSACSRSA